MEFINLAPQNLAEGEILSSTGWSLSQLVVFLHNRSCYKENFSSAAEDYFIPFFWKNHFTPFKVKIWKRQTFLTSIDFFASEYRTLSLLPNSQCFKIQDGWYFYYNDTYWMHSRHILFRTSLSVEKWKNRNKFGHFRPLWTLALIP